MKLKDKVAIVTGAGATYTIDGGMTQH